MVEAELAELEEKKVEIEEELKILLIPKDPNDEKNVIIEIRGGAGEMKLPYLLGIYLECTPVMLKDRAGKLIS